MKKIDCLIVTYNPEIQQLEKTINSISKQVSRVIIVNNGNTKILLKKNDNLTIMNLGKNYGIAYAQNKGLELVLKNSTDFVLLSDQDTIFPENYIQKNVEAFENLKRHNLVALAPVFFNSNKKIIAPIMITKFSYTNDFSFHYIKTAQAISSGSFIFVDALKNIGYMDEKLFIDYVDFEWCWRAGRLGYKIFTITDLVINHQLGDTVKKIYNLQVTLRKDIRYFYMIRNACFLGCYSPYLLFYERILLLKRVALHIVGVFVLKHNFNAIRLITSAVHEGLTGRMRPYSAL